MTAKRRAFGRLPAKDARDKKYPAMLLLRAVRRAALPTQRFYRTGSVLHQGKKPWCVDYMSVQFLLSALLMMKPAKAPQHGSIYHRAQQIDEWPGEDYDGTSVRAGVKVLQERGHISSYLWARNAAEARDWLLAGLGTVMLGTDWHEGMLETDSHGYITTDGEIVGGHAYLCVGFSSTRNAFRIVNSWGSSWGENGRAWVSYEDMRNLIAANGEACLAIEQVVKPTITAPQAAKVVAVIRALKL